MSVIRWIEWKQVEGGGRVKERGQIMDEHICNNKEVVAIKCAEKLSKMERIVEEFIFSSFKTWLWLLFSLLLLVLFPSLFYGWMQFVNSLFSPNALRLYINLLMNEKEHKVSCHVWHTEVDQDQELSEKIMLKSVGTMLLNISVIH